MNVKNAVNNKIILIGSNHHNGLGLARSFAKYGIKPYGIICSKSGENFIFQSRYWEKTILIESEKQIVDVLLSSFSEEKCKPVIITYSDSAEAVIDSNLNVLSEHFILPSINNEQGKIVCLMNKQAQYEFCTCAGVEMLPSQILDIEDVMYWHIDMLPIIIKPVSSYSGDKKDIVIIHSEEELERATRELEQKGYNKVLAQKYLEKRKEYLIVGSILANDYSYSMCENIRQWPPDTGSGSYSRITCNKELDAFCRKVLGIIQKEGYRGCIDIELFGDEKGDYYVNEINWRSSGRNYICAFTGAQSSVAYYYDRVGNARYCGELINKKEGYAINGFADIRNVLLAHNTNPVRWLMEYCNANAHSVIDMHDMGPFFSKCLSGLRVLSRRKR